MVQLLASIILRQENMYAVFVLPRLLTNLHGKILEQVEQNLKSMYLKHPYIKQF